MEYGKRGPAAPRKRRLAAGVTAITLVFGGCGPHYDSFRAGPMFEAAALSSSRRDFPASLARYEQAMGRYPSQQDRALFEMGIIHAHPANPQKDYDRSLECFERIVGAHPASGYRQDSQMMMFYIENLAKKEGIIAAQHERMENASRELREKDEEIFVLQNRIETLQIRLFDLALKYGTADKIRIEKKERRLSLISNGEVLKTYKVALGADPVGPKERSGDNRTPEGTYYIKAKNSDSQYHLSLQVSYPNEADKRRAKELGVPPGGNIMIHGLKNGFSRVGDLHTLQDWTEGCIAVTDEEIEEIYALTPVGTVVEITP